MNICTSYRLTCPGLFQQKSLPAAPIMAALLVIAALGALCLTAGIISYFPKWTVWLGGGIAVSSILALGIVTCKSGRVRNTTASTDIGRLSVKKPDNTLLETPLPLLAIAFGNVPKKVSWPIKINDLGRLARCCKLFNQILMNGEYWQLWERMAEVVNIPLPPISQLNWRKTIIEAKQLECSLKRGKAEIVKDNLVKFNSPQFFEGEIMFYDSGNNLKMHNFRSSETQFIDNTIGRNAKFIPWKDSYITGSEAGTIYFLNKQSKKIVENIVTKNAINCLDHNDEMLAVASIPNRVTLYSLANKKEFKEIKIGDLGINAILVEDSSVWFGGGDGTLRKWNYEDNSIHSFEGHKKAINGLLKVEDMIVSWSLDDTIRLWDSKTGVSKGVLKDDNSSLGIVKVIRIGSTLVSISLDKVIRIWDLDKKICCASYSSPEKAIINSLFYFEKYIYLFSNEGTLFKMKA